MNSISLLAAIAAPNDLWNNLINWLQGSIGNIGWAILLLTLLVKLVTSPLDFMVKFTTKKQTLIQQKCALFLLFPWHTQKLLINIHQG